MDFQDFIHSRRDTFAQACLDGVSLFEMFSELICVYSKLMYCMYVYFSTVGISLAWHMAFDIIQCFGLMIIYTCMSLANSVLGVM